MSMPLYLLRTASSLRGVALLTSAEQNRGNITSSDKMGSYRYLTRMDSFKAACLGDSCIFIHTYIDVCVCIYIYISDLIVNWQSTNKGEKRKKRRREKPNNCRIDTDSRSSYIIISPSSISSPQSNSLINESVDVHIRLDISRSQSG